MIFPIAVPDGGSEAPGGIHAAAAVRYESQTEDGDAEAESERQRVRVPRVPRVPYAAGEEDEYSRGENLRDDPVDGRQHRVNVRHAEGTGLARIVGVQKFLRRCYLQSVLGKMSLGARARAPLEERKGATGSYIPRY